MNDDQAGERFLCPACMQEVTAPAESSPDCLLVYQDGGPADGFVLDAKELEARIAGRGLNAWDLVWQRDNWIPLGRLYQFPPEESPPVDEIPEIALGLSELPPVDGYEPLPRRRKQRREAGGAERKSGGGGGFARWLRKKDVRGRVLFVVKTVLVLSILGVGIARAGRIANYVRKKPVSIMVLAPTDERCEMRIRGKEWEPLYPGAWGSSGEFYVACGCRIKVEFRKDASSPVFLKLRCPVKPGRCTVFNPRGKWELGVYNLAGFKERQLSSRELRNLGREIAAGKAPESAAKVAGQIQDLVKDVLVKKITRQSILSDEYDFSSLGCSFGLEHPVVTAEGGPALCYPLQKRLDFKNGYIEYDPDSSATGRGVLIPENVFQLKNGRKATSGGHPSLQIAHAKDGMILQLSGLRGEVPRKSRKLSGTWSYKAELKNKQWSWQWEFSAYTGGKHFRMTQRMDGTEKTAVR